MDVLGGGGGFSEQMKRRRRDITSVAGVDFPFLSFRTDRKLTRSRIAKTFRTAAANDEDDFKQEVATACTTTRGYFGFMTSMEAFDQSLLLKEDACFIYTSYNGEWRACGKTDILTETTSQHFIDLYEDIGNYFGYRTLIDRGDALIFQKKLKKRVKQAIDCFSIIAKRLRVVKDIRVMIAKQIWGTRREWVN